MYMSRNVCVAFFKSRNEGNSARKKVTSGKRFDLYGVIAGEVEECILEHASMAGGEHKAIAIEPLGILGVIPHDLIIQYVAHRSASHG